MAFPKEHWAQTASTNPLERVNNENNRRSQDIAMFPNGAAIVRLVGALLDEQTDKRQVTRRYMSREVLANLIDSNNPQIPNRFSKRETHPETTKSKTRSYIHLTGRYLSA